MAELTDFDKFKGPSIDFSDLPDGMAEKVQVGDVVKCTDGADETTADVVAIDEAGKKIYLSKEMPSTGDLSVEEKGTGQEAPYDAMKKAAQMEPKDGEKKPSKETLTGPLSNLKKFLIQISIEEQ